MIRYQMPVVLLDPNTRGAAKFGIILDKDINSRICGQHDAHAETKHQYLQLRIKTNSSIKTICNINYKVIKTIKVPNVPMEEANDPIHHLVQMQVLRQKKLRVAMDLDQEVAQAVIRYGIPDENQDIYEAANEEYEEFMDQHPKIGLVLDAMEFGYQQILEYLTMFFLCVAVLLSAGYLDWRSRSCEMLYTIILCYLMIPLVLYIKRKRRYWGWGKVSMIVIE
ncbi:uncharacterized protein SAPINGB_P004189 [Magnusiomyces paraingens]|uniref:Uncharacterized protein n=1 Tax=Magnusiomyces paraingens TaxID=2606893 RepID=A0A5E8BVB7_9ASCO|nr:uncharacterized protein SAPINGB_P004189 [Saprochaete ingens]VVT54664.1 unnamed protein product [Saprochaete ingens]